MAPRIGKRGRIEGGGRKLVYVTKGSKRGKKVDIRDEKRLATFHLRMPRRTEKRGSLEVEVEGGPVKEMTGTQKESSSQTCFCLEYVGI